MFFKYMILIQTDTHCSHCFPLLELGLDETNQRSFAIKTTLQVFIVNMCLPYQALCQERWSRKVGPRCRTSKSTGLFQKSKSQQRWRKTRKMHKEKTLGGNLETIREITMSIRREWRWGSDKEWEDNRRLNAEERMITDLRHLMRINTGDGGGTRDWGNWGKQEMTLELMETKQTRN